MKPVFTKESDSFKLVCKLADDKLKLFLDLEPLKPLSFKREHLLSVLAEFIKSDLLDLGVIDDIVSKINAGEKVTERRIAKGKPAEPGVNGKLLLLVKKYTGQADLKPDAKGYVSYSDLHLFDNITKEQIVGRVYHARKGTDGVSATGEALPSKPGNPIKLNLDKSLLQKKSDNAADEFDLLVSQSEGYLAEESGKLIIKSELMVKGDLDLHIGNIDFIGSVVIQGDANRGFTVKAKKGIEVRGCLNGADLIAPEGPVKIKGLARGFKGTSIRCGQEVFLGLAQELEVNAVGPIRIEKQALDCSLRSASTLEGPAASLVGGESFMVCGADLKNIGNQAGLNTTLVLCSDVEAGPEYMKLAADILSHEKAFQLIELHLGPLAQNPARIQLLKEPHKGKMTQLLAKLKQIKASHEKLLARRDEMMLQAHISQVTRVNVHGIMYEGARIRAGEDCFVPPTEQKGPVSIQYFAETHKFEVGELKALECVPGSVPPANSKGAKDGKK